MAQWAPMFNTVQQSRRNLASAARRGIHPDMADKTSRIGVRLEPELLRKLDELAEEYRRAHPGVRYTRSDVARMLLAQALERASKPRSKS